MERKRSLSILINIVLIISMVISISLPASTKTALAATKLNKTAITLERGQTFLLELPDTSIPVTWKSSNTKISTVSKKGTVKAVSAGKATISATVRGKSYSCKVTVVPTQEDYIALSQTIAVEMANGNFKQLTNIFSAQMKSLLSEDSLKTGLNQVIAELGTYESVYSCTGTKQNASTSVTVVLRYTNNGLKLIINYNQDGQIDGLWSSLYPIEKELASTDKYEESKIAIGSGKYQLSGRLTLPKNVSNPPVVILVHGSGQSDMDETIKGNRPFQDIAWKLAEQGIASIRYNKRYYQYPEYATTSVTIQDEVLDDAANAINYAKTCGKVNPAKIYILGHSLGGMLAPKIAQDNKDVVGIISLAGSPRKLEDIIYDQNAAALNSLPELSELQKSAKLKLISDEVAKVKNVKATDNTTIFGVNSIYWYSLNQINTSDIVKQLNIPMLMLQGKEDFQVYADKDFVIWNDLLRDKNNVVFHLYDNLNHLFMASNGKKDLTEYDTPSHVSDTVILDIAQWISKQ